VDSKASHEVLWDVSIVTMLLTEANKRNKPVEKGTIVSIHVILHGHCNFNCPGGANLDMTSDRIKDDMIE